MISGLMDFDRFGVLTEEGLDEQTIRELVHIAHQEGFAVMAHANGPRTVEAAALAGVDSVEHGAYLDGEALSAMAQAGTVWVPTLSTIGNLRGRDRFDQGAVTAILDSAMENVQKFASLGGLLAPGTDAGACGAYLDGEALSAMAQAGTVWVPTLSTIGNLRGRDRFDQGAVTAILDSAMENVQKFASLGGLLAPGTDAGAWAVPHGSLTEYALLEQALGPEWETILCTGAEEIRRRFS